MNISIFKLFFVCLTIFIFSVITFFKHVQSYSQPDNPQKVNAIVVLTGGAKRINTGLELLHQHYGDKLFISGVGNRLSIDDSKLIDKFQNDSLKENIVIDFQSTSTKENAENTTLWIKKNEFNSIYLVTEQVHLPRALLEFKSRLSSVNIIPWPVQHYNIYDKLNAYNSRIFSVFLKEYLKYYSALIIINLQKVLS